jgi:hypothetical protein
MRFTVAWVCLIICLIIFTAAAILGKEHIAAITAIGLFISGFAVNRLAGKQDGDKPEGN